LATFSISSAVVERFGLFTIIALGEVIVGVLKMPETKKKEIT